MVGQDRHLMDKALMDKALMAKAPMAKVRIAKVHMGRGRRAKKMGILVAHIHRRILRAHKCTKTHKMDLEVILPFIAIRDILFLWVKICFSDKTIIFMQPNKL